MKENSEKQKMSLFQKLYIWIEVIILTRLVPQKSPGPIYKFIFKLPIYMYRIGLEKLIGRGIIILTTTGRKTAKKRETALEFSYNEEINEYIVMAGWGGMTDWYRNAIANPRVQIRTGGKSYKAIAEKIADEEVANILKAITEINPKALRIWSRWSDEPIDETEESLRKAAKHFPSLRIRPIENETNEIG